MRGLPRLVLGLVVVASCLAVAPARAGLFAGRVRREGQWLRDGRGRVLVLRGLNYSGLEFGNFVGMPHGPEEADFAQMASWGVDVIRLPVAWHYLEPAPGVFDAEHLRTQVDTVVRFAARHEIGVVLELHQFLWSPCLGGNGVPAWTCEGKYEPGPGAPFQAQHDFWAGALAPDGRRLIDHLLDVWRRLARHYRGWKSVVGFDFLNEPVDFGDASFEAHSLYPFYREAVAAVRGAHAPQMVVLEPPVLRNVGVRARPEPVGDSNLVYAPHLYTTTFGLPELKYTGDRAAIDRDYAQAAAEAAEQDAVLWVGEYGGSTVAAGGFLAATELFLRHSLEEQEERLVGSAFWAYFPGDNTFSLVDEEGREKGALADVLARPYPVATAGIPQELRYDPVTHDFFYRFAEDSEREVGDPTVVFVPAARQYPRGFAVETSPGDRATFDAARSRILIHRDRSRAVHTLRLRAAP